MWTVLGMQFTVILSCRHASTQTIIKTIFIHFVSVYLHACSLLCTLFRLRHQVGYFINWDILYYNDLCKPWHLVTSIILLVWCPLLFHLLAIIFFVLFYAMKWDIGINLHDPRALESGKYLGPFITFMNHYSPYLEILTHTGTKKFLMLLGTTKRKGWQLLGNLNTCLEPPVLCHWS